MWSHQHQTLFRKGLAECHLFALPWIAYQLTGSAVIMSSLFAINVLPSVLFGPLVGVIIDRYDRKKLLLVAD
ncbi:hypothetical protein DD583_31180, partial [Klebsiella pneumoniae]